MKSYSNNARSLQWQIILYVAPPSILLTVLLGVLTASHVAHVIRQEIQRRVDGAAVQVAEATQEKLSLVIEAARAVAENDVVVNGVVDVEYRTSVSKPFFRSLRLPGANTQSITFCDYRGRPLTGTAGPRNCESESWLAAVMAGNEVVTTDGVSLTLAVPVLYSGSAEAVIVASYPLSEFLHSITGSSESNVIVFDYSGDVVSTSYPALIKAGKVLAVPEGWLMAAAVDTRLTNVHARVVESESTSLRATNTVKMALVSVGGITLVAAAVCVWLISRLATKPLLVLLQQIEKVQATRDLSVRVTASGADEFILLSDRFNSMLAELEHSTVSNERYQRAKQQLEVAMTAGNVGLWDWNTTTDDIYYSSVFKTQLGYPPDTDWTRLSDFESRLHPEDRDPVMQAAEDYLERREPDYQVMFRMRSQDGTYRWIQSKGIAVFDAIGKPQRFVGVHVDLSDRVAQEQKLKKSHAELECQSRELDVANRKSRISEERLSLAIGGTSDGLWDWDIETNKVWYSPRFKALLGFNSNDEFPHVLESFSERIHPDDIDATWEAVASHLDDDIPYSVEYRLQRKAGDYGWFHARGAASRNDEGKAFRMSGSIQDVEDSKRYQQALERSNAELEQFAYVSSHDLQEPLRKVASFCELLGEEYGEVIDGDGKVYLDFVIDGARRMQGLIRDLLSYSRVKSQGKPLQETCTLQALDLALSNLDAAIEESNAEVTHDQLPTVWADPRQLAQLFQNLIANAIKYKSDAAPRVHVGVIEFGDSYTFSICDNGMGISPEYHERIFGIFKRLHGRGEHSGSGIGLAICKQIVERWQGSLWVDSEEGRGSIFSFTVSKTNVGVQDVNQKHAVADQYSLSR